MKDKLYDITTSPTLGILRARDYHVVSNDRGEGERMGWAYFWGIMLLLGVFLFSDIIVILLSAYMMLLFALRTKSTANDARRAWTAIVLIGVSTVGRIFTAMGFGAFVLLAAILLIVGIWTGGGRR